MDGEKMPARMATQLMVTIPAAAAIPPKNAVGKAQNCDVPDTLTVARLSSTMAIPMPPVKAASVGRTPHLLLKTVDPSMKKEAASCLFLLMKGMFMRSLSRINPRLPMHKIAITICVSFVLTSLPWQSH